MTNFNIDKLDYLIFSYILNGSKLHIENIWLKKIWKITYSSDRWPLKTRTKRDVIYNIRSAAWYSKNWKFKPFNSKGDFIKALFDTKLAYSGSNLLQTYDNVRLGL